MNFNDESWFHGIIEDENPQGLGVMHYNYRKYDRGFFKVSKDA